MKCELLLWFFAMNEFHLDGFSYHYVFGYNTLHIFIIIKKNTVKSILNCSLHEMDGRIFARNNTIRNITRLHNKLNLVFCFVGSRMWSFVYEHVSIYFFASYLNYKSSGFENIPSTNCLLRYKLNWRIGFERLKDYNEEVTKVLSSFILRLHYT